MATVSPSLTKAISFNPSKRSFQFTVRNLCDRIESKQMVLPLYQSGIRWILQKNIDLLNYQLLGKAPVSPISINEITDTSIAVEQVTFIDRKLIEGNVQGKYSVTDGQQRLTCNYKAYTDDNSFKNIVLDIGRGRFFQVGGEIQNNQIPVGKLLNKDINEFFAYTNSNSFLKKQEVKDVLMSVRSKLFDYNYTINIAEDLTENEQVDWFEKLNNAGSRVSGVQIKFAKLLVRGMDIYSDYTDIFVSKMDENGYRSLFVQKNTEVSIPIATLNAAYEVITQRGDHVRNFTPMASDTKENQLCALEVSDLKRCFDLTLEALEKTFAFIDDNNLTPPTRIDYITYITGFFVYNHNKELNEKQKMALLDWYEETDFTNKSNDERRDIFKEIIEIRYLGAEELKTV
ncbi:MULTISPECIES: DUF262 domain-containing protein [Bacillus]|uniref:DUF262 domain-containing protein n=1 Tax=Bacillus TaxID=1386 RepID=UPI00025B35E2|nr:MULTISPECIES: DUF262 domain-containing protein [Bacillus]EIF14154.1 hypothetical protein MY7_2488 [Bacillus sp. 5B6]MEC0953893.1 DUF262 domain-containing protein [Bacillus velezensis]MED3705605.1 DUF262 domain-containing protein [Bacillus velezensis]QGI73159.1 DUF262 domain-containing protein [Bacillus velezensis]QNE10619.1 DUF262 domain-containing protein [Bacillus velezensis]